MRRAFLAATAVAVMAAAASAQPLGIQSDFLQDRRERSETAIRFCLNHDSPLVALDAAIAEQLAAALLLDAEFHDLRIDFPSPLDHTIGVTEQDLYIALYTQCDALMGYAYPSDQVADWLTITRPYLQTREIALAVDPQIDALADLAAGDRIGTRMGARGDGAVLRYTLAQAQANRWQRLPYATAPLVLERLVDGTTRAAVLWEPAVAEALRTGLFDAGQFREIDTRPVPAPTLDFGIAMLAEQTFLRGLLDEAIVATAADGTLARTIEGSGILASVPD